ncbi:MAG: polyprenyl synthetase family protein [Betaproteobacteria bacterium]|nr:polyprenyl synthetase family protein [Betaproteobacteria bacterium]
MVSTLSAEAFLAWSDWSGRYRQRIETVLDELLPPAGVEPPRLHQAMRYAALGGGKRVRPLLAYAACELAGGAAEPADRVAAAVELIHAYSLIHDDLPCMDDDDLRRGQPSCHRQFDEATAMLAGDALQALAFEIVAGAKIEPPAVHVQLLELFARACGSRGMAGGQAIDLASVGGELGVTELESMHIHKTGALIRAAVLMGAACGRALNGAEGERLDHYAKAIGLAFQVVDDILDAEGTSASLGKTAGKDAAANKPTYVTALGLTAAKARARELHQEARAALTIFHEGGRRLMQLADYIVLRQS